MNHCMACGAPLEWREGKLRCSARVELDDAREEWRDRVADERTRSQLARLGRNREAYYA